MSEELLRATPTGIVLQVKALAGSRRNELRGIENDRLKVAVTAAPEKGRANQAIARILADLLGLPPRCVILIQGATASRKTFLLTGVSLDQVRTQLKLGTPS